MNLADMDAIENLYIIKNNMSNIDKWVIENMSLGGHLASIKYDVAKEAASKMQEQMQRKVSQAREEGELLAYNCEKRAREQMIEKACKWFKSFCKESGRCEREWMCFGCPRVDALTKAMKGE